MVSLATVVTQLLTKGAASTTQQTLVRSKKGSVVSYVPRSLSTHLSLSLSFSLSLLDFSSLERERERQTEGEKREEKEEREKRRDTKREPVHNSSPSHILRDTAPNYLRFFSLISNLQS